MAYSRPPCFALLLFSNFFSVLTRGDVRRSDLAAVGGMGPCHKGRKNAGLTLRIPGESPGSFSHHRSDLSHAREDSACAGAACGSAAEALPGALEQEFRLEAIQVQTKDGAWAGSWGRG